MRDLFGMIALVRAPRAGRFKSQIEFELMVLTKTQ